MSICDTEFCYEYIRLSLSISTFFKFVCTLIAWSFPQVKKPPCKLNNLCVLTIVVYRPHRPHMVKSGNFGHQVNSDTHLHIYKPSHQGSHFLLSWYIFIQIIKIWNKQDHCSNLLDVQSFLTLPYLVSEIYPSPFSEALAAVCSEVVILLLMIHVACCYSHCVRFLLLLFFVLSPCFAV